jgi:hypothetical protein
MTFRHQRDPLLNLLALGSGALMLSPYAMAYDLALLAPALAVGVDRRKPAVTAAAYVYAMGFWISGVLAIVAPLILLIGPLFLPIRVRGAPASTETQT